MATFGITRIAHHFHLIVLSFLPTSLVTYLYNHGERSSYYDGYAEEFLYRVELEEQDLHHRKHRVWHPIHQNSLTIAEGEKGRKKIKTLFSHRTLQTPTPPQSIVINFVANPGKIAVVEHSHGNLKHTGQRTINLPIFQVVQKKGAKNSTPACREKLLMSQTHRRESNCDGDNGYCADT